MNKVYLYEILVPTIVDKKHVDVTYHRLWDVKVKKITGGLTIHKSSKGYWVDGEGETFAERMIPVKIMCTEEQMQEIADITAEHYNQISIMFYRVSSEVTIKNYYKMPASRLEDR